MNPPKVVVADTPDRGCIWYLVDANLDFVPEVKLFLDWKAATRHAPATIKAYCVNVIAPWRQIGTIPWRSCRPLPSSRWLLKALARLMKPLSLSQKVPCITPLNCTNLPPWSDHIYKPRQHHRRESYCHREVEQRSGTD